jgi:hypothetical protein
MSKDPQFDQMVRKQVSEVYKVGIGAETDKILKEVLSAPPEALEYNKKLQIKAGVTAK